MLITADHQIRATKISGSCDYENSETTETEQERETSAGRAEESTMILQTMEKQQWLWTLTSMNRNSPLLSDDKTYEKLKKDPTQKYKRQLVSIIRKLKDDDKITEEQYKYLYPTAENLGLIVDYTGSIGSIGYNVPRSLADLLVLIVDKTLNNIKNSGAFSQ